MNEDDHIWSWAEKYQCQSWFHKYVHKAATVREEDQPKKYNFYIHPPINITFFS